MKREPAVILAIGISAIQFIFSQVLVPLGIEITPVVQSSIISLLTAGGGFWIRRNVFSPATIGQDPKG